MKNYHYLKKIILKHSKKMDMNVNKYQIIGVLFWQNKYERKFL